MLPQSTWKPPWQEPAWQEEAHSWIQTQLDDLGFTLKGEIDQFHIRPWSTVMRLKTDQGVLYFKAGAPIQAFEPGLLQALTRWRPKDSLPVLAANLPMGWALTPDAGSTLRQRIQEGEDARIHYERLLPQYADYQLETAYYAAELIALGCPDRRLQTLPDQYEDIISEKDLLLRENDWLTIEDYHNLIKSKSLIEELSARLAQPGIPTTIEHGDLHTNNIFVSGSGYSFFDWGDACLSHPFFSMTVSLRSIAGDLNSQDPSLHWARDAYLEPFTVYGTKAELVAAFNAAQHLGRFQRSLCWYAVLKSINLEYTTDYHYYFHAWLGLFLHFPSED